MVRGTDGENKEARNTSRDQVLENFDVAIGSRGVPDGEIYIERR